jgi:hypothetical protein
LIFLLRSIVGDLDPAGSGPFLSDPDSEILPGSLIRIRPPKGAYCQSEKAIFSHKHFQYFSFSANHEINFRAFGPNYLNFGILNYFLSQRDFLADRIRQHSFEETEQLIQLILDGLSIVKFEQSVGQCCGTGAGGVVHFKNLLMTIYVFKKRENFLKL